MNNDLDRPARAGLCIEITQLYGRGDIMAVLSLPGRKGTVTRVWRKGASSVPVTVPTAEDIRSWVAQAVWDWLVTVPGAQDHLPGLEAGPVQGTLYRSDE